MLDLKNTVLEKCIIVGVKTSRYHRMQIEENLDELERLAETAGADIIFRVIQEKRNIDPAFFIGKGKAAEIAELADLNEVSAIIFDDDLNPTQIRNLEELIDKKIIDRSGLILDIFASHAKTNEAKTQVELAQLEYMLPRLTRAWTHLSKQYGGIGTKGPGETQIETDRRIIRTKIKKLKERLDKFESRQLTKSLQRKNFFTTTLVGYTNAGKSTLLNLLTDADVLAEDKLFATLDSTTRSFEIKKGRPILITDTVGFIRKLPHNLIASFKSTLNVVRQADLILHVIDISHPFYKEHIQIVDNMLKELDCSNKPALMIFNKADAVKDKTVMEYVSNKFKNCVVISAAKGINISRLKKILSDTIESNFVEQSVTLRNDQSRQIALIHQLAEVLSIDYEDDFVLIKYKANLENNSKIAQTLEKTQGRREI